MEVSNQIKDLLHYVQSLFDKPVYLVGGGVRDIVLKVIPKDYDFCTAATVEEIKAALKGKHRAYLIGERHGTIGFKVKDEMVEITTFRTETYKPGSRQPKVEFVTSLHDDLSRRDLTIGAMAMRCGDLSIIDPFGGLDDIERKVVRAVGNPKLRIKEDPLRMMRAVRIALQKGFIIDTKLYSKIKSMAHYLLTLSKERLVDEMDKILSQDFEHTYYLNLLWDLNIFKYIIPELQLQYGYDQNNPYHKYDLHVHTCKVIQAIPKEHLDLRWAALLHDVAKPFTMSINKKGYSNYIHHEILGADIALKTAIHLKWSKKRREFVYDMILNHMEDGAILKIYDEQGKR